LMSEEHENDIDDGPDDDEADLNSKEGWVGASRPAAKPAPPPVADRANRPKLYTTVAVKAIDSSTFSESVKSNRVWWTPEDDQLPDADETPFDVDITENAAVAKKYKVADVTRRADYFVIKSARDASGKDYSIKAIDIDVARSLGQSVEALAAEMEMFKLCGANCAEVCSGFEASQGASSLCLVLECVGGAPLNVQLARGAENYTESDARRLAAQCARAVAAVHKQGVVHRDIGPDVFIFTSKSDIDHVKLCDFSFAVRSSGLVAGAPGGDPEFQAPEIARDEKHGAPCDVWSLGCLVHLLVAGTPPLHDSNTARLRQKISKGGAPLGGEAWPKAASPAALACVKALLVTDVKARPTAAAAAAHAWFGEKSDAPLNTFKATLSGWNGDR